MSFVSGIVSGIGNAIGSAISAVGNLVVSAVNTVVGAVSGVVSAIGNTVNAILKDPLPTLLMVGGAMVGIPPYVTAGVITAAKGGNLEDIAKSAAISYITSEALSSTNIGSEISGVTKTAGQDFTNYMMENYSLPPDSAVAIAKAATASLNSSIVGGVNAAISGKSVVQGMTTGFTSGLIYSSTNSYFDSINKDPNWGFSDKALNLMKGSASTVLNTIVSGKGDPSQALGNYIAYATINMGGSTLGTAVKTAYTNLTTDTAAAQKAQDAYTLAKADVDAKAKEGETLRNEINTAAAALNTRINDEYNPVKTQLDEQLKANETAVATFNEQKKLFDDNKWAYENYAAKIAEMGLRPAQDDDGNITGSYKLTPNGRR